MSAGPRGQYQATYVRGEEGELVRRRTFSNILDIALVAEASAGILGQLRLESIGAAAHTG